MDTKTSGFSAICWGMECGVMNMSWLLQFLEPASCFMLSQMSSSANVRWFWSLQTCEEREYARAAHTRPRT